MQHRHVFCMRTRLALLALLLLALALSACGDPGAIDRAKAAQIEQETRDQAAERALERQAEAEAMQRTQEQYESTRAAVSFAKSFFFILIGLGLAIAAVLSLFILVWRLRQGTRALVQRAKVWGVSIPMDRKTGSYPLLLVQGHVVDPNTGKAIPMGEALDANPQLAAGSHYTRALGVATEGAVQIGQATKSPSVTDAIMTTSGAIPLSEGPLTRERQAVQDSELPGLLKAWLDQKLANREETLR